MANGAFKFKDNSGNIVSFISGSGSNISFSGGSFDPNTWSQYSFIWTSR